MPSSRRSSTTQVARPPSLSVENTVPGAESSCADSGIAYCGSQSEPAQRRSPSGVNSTTASETGSGSVKLPSQMARTFIGSPRFCGGLHGIKRGSVQRWLPSQGDVGDEVIRAVGPEWVHEGARPDVAVRTREQVPVAVAGSA